MAAAEDTGEEGDRGEVGGGALQAGGEMVEMVGTVEVEGEGEGEMGGVAKGSRSLTVGGMPSGGGDDAVSVCSNKIFPPESICPYLLPAIFHLARQTAKS